MNAPGLRRRRVATWTVALAALVATACREDAAPVPSGAATPTASAAPTEPARPRVQPTVRPGYRRPKLVDVHGHLSIFGVWRIEHILEDVGIGAIVNLSGGSGRGGRQSWMLAQILSERLGGRVLNFANVDWQGCCDPAWGLREAARLETAVRDHQFRGLKISKALGLSVRDRDRNLVAVDDPRLDPLWQAAGRLGIPVAIHIADPKAFWLPPTADNERYAELSVHPGWSWYQRGVPDWSALLDAGDRLFARHPGTTFVAVHFGNAAEDLERVTRMLERLPNVWLDLSARVGEFGRHPPEAVRALMVRFADRILFGTDIGVGEEMLMLGSNGAVEPQMSDVVPFYDAHFRYFEGSERQIDHPSPIQGNWKVDAIELPDAVLDKIYRDNAVRLFDLDPTTLIPRPRRSPSPPPAATP
ncbi:MAG: hypothetical protein RIT45_3899 [Pseudomonadota bacterium]